MIDIRNYKETKLGKVAQYERAKKGKIYPKESTLIQVSATSGEVEYLEKDSEASGKYVVVTPNKEINPRYFNIVVKRNIEHFRSKYQVGMNIQQDDIKHMPIQHHNRPTQDMIAEQISLLEKEEETTRKEIEILQTTKQRFARDLFV